MNMHANTHQMTIETIYRSARSDAMCDGDLRSPTEIKQNDMVPSPMTSMVVQPCVPPALASFKPSEPHGGYEYLVFAAHPPS